MLDYCENPTNAAFYLFVVRNVIFIALVIHGAACFWFKIACNGFDQVDGTNGTKIVVNKCEQGIFIFLLWFFFLFSIFINIIYLGVDANAMQEKLYKLIEIKILGVITPT